MPYRPSKTIQELEDSIRALGGTLPPRGNPPEGRYHVALYWTHHELLRCATPPASPSSAPALPEGSRMPL